MTHLNDCIGLFVDLCFHLYCRHVFTEFN